MIVDERSYTLVPGTVPEYLVLYEEEGMPVQVRVLGNMIGYFTSEVGELNQIVHLWGYDSMAERERRRALLAKEPEWQAFLAKARSRIVTMRNRILVSTSFSPLR